MQRLLPLAVVTAQLSHNRYRTTLPSAVRERERDNDIDGEREREREKDTGKYMKDE
jgi:hypothetical protein